MELSYRQLETALVAYLAIKPDRVPTFRSRIKQLQRLEFPDGVNVGRGAKMAYSAAHMFKLAVAFELIGMGLPAQVATRIVERHWEQFSVACALVVRNQLRWWHDKPVYVRLILQSLADIQFSSLGAVEESKAFVQDAESLNGILALNSQRSANCYPVICFTDLTIRLTELAQNVAGVPNALYDSELIDWIPSEHPDWLLLHGTYKRASRQGAIKTLERLYGTKVAEAMVDSLWIIDEDKLDGGS